MKRMFLPFTLIFTLIFCSTAFAVVKSGATCTKLGATSIASGKKYTCIKSGKKLIWNKGITVKKPVAVIPDLTKVVSTSSTETSAPSKSFDSNDLPILLIQPQFNFLEHNADRFTIKFTVSPEATGGYIEAREIDIDYKNSFTKKNSIGLVTIEGKVPIDNKLDRIRIYMYAASDNARSSCCSSVDLILKKDESNSKETTTFNSPNIGKYVVPMKFSNLPNSTLSDSSLFSNLDRCRLKDGDPILDNMTVGFPLPSGRTDLSKPVKIAVLGADFPDVQASTSPAVDYSAGISDLKNFWERQASTGLQIEMLVPEKYKRMPSPIMDYQLGSSLNGFKGDNYWAFIQKVIDAYDNEINFSGVSTVVVVVPLSVTAAQIGTWVVYTQGVFKTNENNIYNVMITGNGNSKFYTSSWVHEYGHTLGLTDMRYVNETNPTIQGPEGLGIYDVMGSGNAAPEILVWSRFLIGILLPNQIHCVTTANTSTHWLIPIAQQRTDVKGVVIPLTDFTAIVVESRRNYGYDKIGTDAEGAIVYTIDTRKPYRRSPAFIVSPSRSKDLEWYTDSALKNGESVTTNGWKISVIESGDFGDVIKVEKVS